jgi:AcrR family transcriptional regulator
MSSMSTPQTWGGRTADQRRADRRARLVHAAFEIWGDRGWAAVTMRGVCARAGLIDRYFYESFADRDALLVAVWDQVHEESTSAITAVIGENAEATALDLLREVITVMVHRFAAEPRRAQILFGDHSGSSLLEERRLGLALAVADLMATDGLPRLDTGVDEAEFQRSMLMAVGGVMELVTAWRAGAVDLDADGLVEQITRFGTVLSGYYLAEPG